MSDDRILFNTDSENSYDRVFSNFTRHPVTFGGRTYSIVEHAFQSQKTIFPGERKVVFSAPTPGKAKRAGRAVTLRDDWNDVKYSVMLALLWLKFTQHAGIQQILLDTEDREIAEHASRWNDRIWGLGRAMNGQNLLGKALMEV